MLHADNEGRTPLECARGWGHKESMALLEVGAYLPTFSFPCPGRRRPQHHHLHSTPQQKTPPPPPPPPQDAQRAYALRKARRLVDAAAAADAAEGQLQRGGASTKAAQALAPARRLGRPEAGERAALPRVEFSPTPGVEEGKEEPPPQPQKKPSQAGVARAVAAFVLEVNSDCKMDGSFSRCF